MDLPAQICLILASCSLPIRLLEIASDAKDPLASRPIAISDANPAPSRAGYLLFPDKFSTLSVVLVFSMLPSAAPASFVAKAFSERSNSDNDPLSRVYRVSRVSEIISAK
jgi:hypothetical protein